MPTFIRVFIPFFLKISVLGLKKPEEKISVLGKVCIGLDYTLYLMYFLNFLLSSDPVSAGAGGLYQGALIVSVGLFAADATADILCRLVKRPDMYGLSLKLRYVCCGLGTVIVAMYAVMRFRGMVTYESVVSAVLSDSAVALCVASVGMIIVRLKRLQKDYSDF